MTIAHIAWQYGETNTGGAALSATRLHLALLARGVDSHYICVHNRDAHSNCQVHVLPRGLFRHLYLFLTKFTRCMWKFTPYRRSVSINAVPLFGLEKELKRIKPDIVHVQWINSDVCTYEQLAKLPYRMVFNLHDLYMLLGLGVHPGDDPRFEQGFTAANSPRLERWLFNRKRRLIEKKRPAFIADSRWVESICRRSLIGRNFPVHTIYNLPDAIFMGASELGLGHRSRSTMEISDSTLQLFTPTPTKSSPSPNPSPNAPTVLLFGCYGGLTNRFKGFPDLLKAFELLTPEERGRIELRIFGAKEISRAEGEKLEKLGIRMVNLGIPPNDQLAKEYAAADIFLFPSVKETLGMTKIEAMLCGLPVIAFSRTACAEGIEHKATGWIAPDGDHRSYAEGIRYFMTHPVDRAAIAAQARVSYSLDSIADQVLAVYSSCLNAAEMI